MLKITQNTYKKVWGLIFFSLTLKLILFAFKYFGAYRYYSAYPVRMYEVSFPLVNPDELEYLSRAKDGSMDFILGHHWFYEWINSAVYDFFQDIDKSYIFLCLLNIFMSLGYPFWILPIIRSFSINNQLYNQIFLYYSSVILFWPSAIWMAISNMKDTSLGLMIVGYISCLTQVNFIIINNKRLSTKNKIILFLFIFLSMILAFLIFSTRSYMSLILIVSTFFYLLLTRTIKVYYKFAYISLIFLLLIISGITDLIFNIVEEGNSFLLNPEKAEEAAALTNAVSPNQEKFEVSYNLINIIRNILLLYFGAFPYIGETISFISFLLMVQTAISVFFIRFFINSLKKIWEHNLKYFYIAYLGGTSLFYGIVSLNGPRQRLATIDLLIIVFIVAYLAHGNQYKKFDLICGLCVYMTMLIFTNRMLLS